MKCEFCNNEADIVITRIMQPSWPHPICINCWGKISYREAYMILEGKDKI